MIKRVIAALVLVILLLSGLVACSGNSGKENVPDTNKATESPTNKQTEPTPETGTEEPDNVEYDLSDDKKVLRVTGKGACNIPNQIRDLGKDNVEELIIEEGITSVKGGSFYYFSALQKVTFPDTLSEIIGGSFARCIKLTEITLPKGVKKLGKEAFYDCNNLKVVNLNEGLETIGESAFFNCNELTEIVLPESIKTVGDKWVDGECADSLTTVRIPAGIESLGVGLRGFWNHHVDVYFGGTKDEWLGLGQSDSDEYMTVHYGEYK